MLAARIWSIARKDSRVDRQIIKQCTSRSLLVHSHSGMSEPESLPLAQMLPSQWAAKQLLHRASGLGQHGSQCHGRDISRYHPPAVSKRVVCIGVPHTNKRQEPSWPFWTCSKKGKKRTSTRVSKTSPFLLQILFLNRKGRYTGVCFPVFSKTLVLGLCMLKVFRR